MELIKEKATPEGDNRGRQRDHLTSVVSSKQVQRNQLEICPGLVSGDAYPMCRGRDPEPKAGDAASDDGFSVEKTSSEVGETQSSKRDSGCTDVNTEGLSDGRQGKKKHRRRPSKKKRRWKPYFKLTWEEKKELDERETARASRVRAEMFAKGLPVAPYNTTQFLMEEHDREEPDLNTELGGRKSGAMRSDDTASEEENFEAEEDEEEEGGGGSDGMGRPGQAGGEFLQRDFSETYERYHVETLQNMSKQELVKEYLELEKCMSRLEEENNWLRCVRRNTEGADDASSADAYGARRVRELETEVERLKAENNELLLKTPKTKGSGLNQSQPC